MIALWPNNIFIYLFHSKTNSTGVKRECSTGNRIKLGTSRVRVRTGDYSRLCQRPDALCRRTKTVDPVRDVCRTDRTDFSSAHGRTLIPKRTVRTLASKSLTKLLDLRAFAVIPIWSWSNYYIWGCIYPRTDRHYSPEWQISNAGDMMVDLLLFYSNEFDFKFVLRGNNIYKW